MTTEQRPWMKNLADARHLAAGLSERLPTKVDLAALGVRSQFPLFRVLTFREALFWRTEELARNACDTLGNGDFATAALLIRGIAESAAMTWYLLEVIESRARYTPVELKEKLMPMFAGTKIWTDGPQAINVLTYATRLEKEMPGFRNIYDILSEYAHPNWRGVSGLYSKLETETFTVHLGHGFHPELVGGQLSEALVAVLLTFVGAYNKVADVLPAFVTEIGCQS